MPSDQLKRRDFITLICAATTWLLAARGQHSSKPFIGFLSPRSLEESAHLVPAFHSGLAENGLIEGQTVTIEYRWAAGKYDRLAELAQELVGVPAHFFQLQSTL